MVRPKVLILFRSNAERRAIFKKIRFVAVVAEGRRDYKVIVFKKFVFVGVDYHPPSPQ